MEASLPDAHGQPPGLRGPSQQVAPTLFEQQNEGGLCLPLQKPSLWGSLEPDPPAPAGPSDDAARPASVCTSRETLSRTAQLSHRPTPDPHKLRQHTSVAALGPEF